VIAGKEYGAGSSRDWAAKGALLLVVKVVLAETYERIHRSNLVGMGVLPLEFRPGENAASLGLSGSELFDVEGGSDRIEPRQTLSVIATRPDGAKRNFQVVARLDSAIDVDYYRQGGILQAVLRGLLGVKSD